MQNSAVKTNNSAPEIVPVRDLVKHFPVADSDDVVRAVDGMSSAKLWVWWASGFVHYKGKAI